VNEQEAAAFRAGSEAMRKAAAENLQARYTVELLMRDGARRCGLQNTATLHGDRAQVLKEAADAIAALKVEDAVP
jgi:hypothetical protein